MSYKSHLGHKMLAKSRVDSKMSKYPVFRVSQVFVLSASNFTRENDENVGTLYNKFLSSSESVLGRFCCILLIPKRNSLTSNVRDKLIRIWGFKSYTLFSH